MIDLKVSMSQSPQKDLNSYIFKQSLVKKQINIKINKCHNWMS